MLSDYHYFKPPSVNGWKWLAYLRMKLSVPIPRLLAVLCKLSESRASSSAQSTSCFAAADEFGVTHYLAAGGWPLAFQSALCAGPSERGMISSSWRKVCSGVFATKLDVPVNWEQFASIIILTLESEISCLSFDLVLLVSTAKGLLHASALAHHD